MSFKVPISDVLIWNKALQMLPAEPVASIVEQSIEARECRRAYKPLVAELLEMYHWGLATRRVALAVVTNDRLGEWQYAYAKPDDLAYPVKTTTVDGAGYGGWAWRVPGLKMFEQVGGVIYSTVEAAVLEYTSLDITEADFTNVFSRIVEIELAARICMPITKSATREKDLATLSEGMKQRAMANDLNRNQPTYGDQLTESNLVRFGAIAPERFSRI